MTLLLALLLATSSLMQPSPAATHLIDVTGDGAPDKLLIDASGRLSVAVHVGGRSFAAVPQELPGVDITDLLASDLDGDGQLDLYVVSPGENLALLGDGSGRFVPATAALGLSDGGVGRTAERHDLDGDGLPELLLANRGGDVLFWRQPDGTFLRDSDTPTPAVDSTGDAATLTDEQREILSHLSLVWLDDGFGTLRKTVRFTGVNVQIVNGLRATNGHGADPYTIDPALTATNGLGNLIVGYDEPLLFEQNDRRGSHNIVVGKEHLYASYGGLVAGDHNRIAAAYACVSGGWDNSALGPRSSCGGGVQNQALDEATTVAGGAYNCAIGHFSTVSGGAYNMATGEYATCSGGEKNEARGINSSATGGAFNVASGTVSSVSGGQANEAAGFGAAVSGGEQNTAISELSSVSGGADNTAGLSEQDGHHAAVCGGRHGVAGGDFSSVQAGGGNLPSDGNVAGGDFSSVSGGRARAAAGEADWAAGSLHEDS